MQISVHAHKAAGNSWDGETIVKKKMCNSCTLYLFYWPLSEFYSICKLQLPLPLVPAFIPSNVLNKLFFTRNDFIFLPFVLSNFCFIVLLLQIHLHCKQMRKIPLGIPEPSWEERRLNEHSSRNSNSNSKRTNINAAVNWRIRSPNALFGFLLCHGKSNTLATGVGALFSFPRFAHKHKIHFLFIAFDVEVHEVCVCLCSVVWMHTMSHKAAEQMVPNGIVSLFESIACKAFNRQYNWIGDAVNSGIHHSRRVHSHFFSIFSFGELILLAVQMK